MSTNNLQRLLALSLIACLAPANASLAHRSAPPQNPSQKMPEEQLRALEVAPTPLPGTQLTTDWRASRLIGTTMTNMLDEPVGRVEDVVIDSDGKVVAVMVGVGGFLGMGETSVAVGLRHLVITRPDPDHLEVKTSLTREAIEQAASIETESDDPAAPHLGER